MPANSTLKRITIICAECESSKVIPLAWHKKYGNHFCSRSCYFAFQRSHPHTRRGQTAIPAIKKECLQCGAKFTVPAGRQSQMYYGEECKHEASFIPKDCLRCGVRFMSYRSANKLYCSADCVRTRPKSETNIPCQRCGKIFYSKRPELIHCSEKCRRPPHMIDCLNCGKTFRVVPVFFHGTRRFCSVRCYRSYSGESLPEQNTRVALDTLGIDYIQEHAIKGLRKPVDFYLPAFHLVLEVDSLYWHERTIERDKRKDAKLQAMGYAVLRIETDPLFGKVLTPTMVEYVRHAIVPFQQAQAA